VCIYGDVSNLRNLYNLPSDRHSPWRSHTTCALELCTRDTDDDKNGLEGNDFILNTKLLGGISRMVLAEELTMISISTRKAVMDGSGGDRRQNQCCFALTLMR
jgi:hypothetical protein